MPTQQQILQFRQEMIKKGVKPSHVDQFIADKTRQAATSTTTFSTSNTTPDKPKGPIQGTGNALKNFGVGVLKGTHQWMNNIARPISNVISKVTGGTEESIATANEMTDAPFVPQNTGEEVGAAVGHTLPYIGAGLATAGATTAAGFGTLSAAGTQGLVQGGLAFGATEGSFDERLNTGLTVGATAAVLDIAIPFTFKQFGTSKKAVNTAFETINKANQHYAKIGNELVERAKTLTNSNPKATIPFIQNFKLAQQLDEVGIDVTEYVTKGLTPADVQVLSSRINQAAAMASEKQATQLLGLNRAFRDWARVSFNKTSQGVGDALEKLYSNAQLQYEAMKTVDDIFRPVKSPSASDAQKLLHKVKELTGTGVGREALKKTVAEYKAVSGIDLTNPIKAMKHYHNLTPALKKAAAWLIPAVFGYEIAKYLPL